MSDGALDLLVLVGDFVALETGEALEAHVQNGLCLRLRESESAHQPITGTLRIWRGANQLDHGVEIVERYDEALENVGALPGAIEVVGRAP